MTVANEATRSYVSTSWAYPLTAATLEQSRAGNNNMLEQKQASWTALLSIPFPHTPCSGNNGSLPCTSAGIDRNSTCNIVQTHVWSWHVDFWLKTWIMLGVSCVTSNSFVPTAHFNTWIMESWTKELPIFSPNLATGSMYLPIPQHDEDKWAAETSLVQCASCHRSTKPSKRIKYPLAVGR